MLLEIAIGDAYGAGFEYVDPAIVAAHNDLSAYVAHPKHNIGRGRYTDDAQMSIAVTEVLLLGGMTRQHFADAFVGAFKRDQREGYAGGFYKFLCGVANGTDFIAQIKPFSDKSGAAMRAVTLGILPSVERVREVCTLQAKLTHDTADGIAAALAASLAAHYFLYGLGKKADLGKWLDANVPGRTWSTAWTGRVGEKGWESVQAAITAVIAGDSMTDILKRCVAFTGDVDTVAAVAMGVASVCSEVKQDLPQNLIDGLENGTYGRDYLRALDGRLTAEFERLRASAK
jgi:ADP-ribosyl-[dinitrogen reductase] hydrolase